MTTKRPFTKRCPKFGCTAPAQPDRMFCAAHTPPRYEAWYSDPRVNSAWLREHGE